MEQSGNKSVSFSPKSEMTQLSRSQFLSVFTDILRAMVPCALRKGLSYTTSLQHTRCLHFHQLFFIIFCAFLQINRQMSTFSYYRKRQCFRLIFVPTRIRIQESPINADPEHFFSQKLERENKLKAIKAY